MKQKTSQVPLKKQNAIEQEIFIIYFYCLFLFIHRLQCISISRYIIFNVHT